MHRRDLLNGALAALALSAAAESEAHEEPAAAGARSKAAEVLKHALPEMTGKEATMVTVDYPPGGGSVPHTHPGSVFGYVLEGAVVMGLDGGPEKTYRKGEAFYEAPGQLHGVSRNASKTRPARILAVVIGDVGAPVTTPRTSGAK